MYYFVYTVAAYIIMNVYPIYYCLHGIIIHIILYTSNKNFDKVNYVILQIYSRKASPLL